MAHLSFQVPYVPCEMSGNSFRTIHRGNDDIMMITHWKLKNSQPPKKNPKKRVQKNPIARTIASPLFIQVKSPAGWNELLHLSTQKTLPLQLQLLGNAPAIARGCARAQPGLSFESSTGVWQPWPEILERIRWKLCDMRNDRMILGK